MKKSGQIVWAAVGIGAVIGVGVWIVWPSTPWYIFVGLAFGTLIGIPKAIKVEAEQTIAKKILDE
ncbi:MAG: hypothetical protein Q8R67_12265 [Rhodoferax sp.]|nr:hypothetical protein [Rhodoferax sp.]MDP3652447.1 hypothetical protein [Rhodoferax sp.]